MSKRQKLEEIVRNNFRSIRLANDIKHKDIACKLGLTRQDIQRAETGRRNLTYMDVYTLSKLADFPMEDFAEELEFTRKK